MLNARASRGQRRLTPARDGRQHDTKSQSVRLGLGAATLSLFISSLHCQSASASSVPCSGLSPLAASLCGSIHACTHATLACVRRCVSGKLPRLLACIGAHLDQAANTAKSVFRAPAHTARPALLPRRTSRNYASLVKPVPSTKALSCGLAVSRPAGDLQTTLHPQTSHALDLSSSGVIDESQDQGPRAQANTLGHRYARRITTCAL